MTGRERLLQARILDSGSPWLSRTQAAEYLGVSERTIERKAKTQRIRPRYVGSRQLFHRDDLDALASGRGGRSANHATPPRGVE